MLKETLGRVKDNLTRLAALAVLAPTPGCSDSAESGGVNIEVTTLFRQDSGCSVDNGVIETAVLDNDGRVIDDNAFLVRSDCFKFEDYTKSEAFEYETFLNTSGPTQMPSLNNNACKVRVGYVKGEPESHFDFPEDPEFESNGMEFSGFEPQDEEGLTLPPGEHTVYYKIVPVSQ